VSEDNRAIVGYSHWVARDVRSAAAAAAGDLPHESTVRRTSPPPSDSLTAERFRQDAFRFVEDGTTGHLVWLRAKYERNETNLTVGMDSMARANDGALGTMSQAQAALAAQVLHQAVATSSSDPTSQDSPASPGTPVYSPGFKAEGE